MSSSSLEYVLVAVIYDKTFEKTILKQTNNRDLPEVQEDPEGQCCLVCMCKSVEEMDTWPHLSEKEDRRESN